MNYSRSRNSYIPLIPPIDKPYTELTKIEAKMYFEWYMSHIDERTEYLRTIVAEDLSISIDKLDFSVLSLKLIWKWFLSVVEVRKVSFKELTHGLWPFSDKIAIDHQHLFHEPQIRLGTFSYFVLRDIGMYVGKMFVINYPALQWTFKTKPKNYISVNEPLLVGFIDDNPIYPKPFYPDLEPISFAEGCALNVIDHTQHEDDLYNLCMKWIAWIPMA